MLPSLRSMPIASCAALALLVSGSSLCGQTTPVVPLTPNQIYAQLDPQMTEVVLLYDANKGTPVFDLSPQDARQQFSLQDAGKIIARGVGSEQQPIPVGKVQDGVTVPGQEGNQIPIRIYTPAGTGPFPVIVYFHGGGFVLATIDTYDASARALCNDAKAIVVSVEYRKAPEAPFPAAREDAIASYKWVINNIGMYNGIAKKVAVAGESAGGNLATEVAISARNQNLQRPTHQLLIYPLVSTNTNQISDQLYTSSALPLNTAGVTYFLDTYAPTAAERNSPQAAPINADVANLPPTTIIAAQFDPLEGDGMLYAAKLKGAGNAVVYQLYTGVTHEFFGLGAVVDKARQAELFGAARVAASFQ